MQPPWKDLEAVIKSAASAASTTAWERTGDGLACAQRGRGAPQAVVEAALAADEAALAGDFSSLQRYAPASRCVMMADTPPDAQTKS